MLSIIRDQSIRYELRYGYHNHAIDASKVFQFLPVLHALKGLLLDFGASKDMMRAQIASAQPRWVKYILTVRTGNFC
jgi:hypothetical protein